VDTERCDYSFNKSRLSTPVTSLLFVTVFVPHRSSELSPLDRLGRSLNSNAASLPGMSRVAEHRRLCRCHLGATTEPLGFPAAFDDYLHLQRRLLLLPSTAAPHPTRARYHRAVCCAASHHRCVHHAIKQHVRSVPPSFAQAFRSLTHRSLRLVVGVGLIGSYLVCPLAFLSPPLLRVCMVVVWQIANQNFFGWL
jgi:hypothetical protein